MHIFQRIRSLLEEGKNYCEISAILKIHRKTVSKYARQNCPAKYSQRVARTRGDPFLTYKDRVTRLLESSPKLSATEIFEWLVEQGYSGSERTVHRRLSELRTPKQKERDFDQEYEAGEQAQFDFKESVDLPFKDGMREVHFHVSTLPFSDLCIVKSYPQKNYECFMDGVHSFFEEIGGQPKNIRFDNLSPVVKKVLKGSRIYTDKFSKAIDYYGFGCLPCSPGRGNEKGDVERDIQTFSRTFLNFVQMYKIVFESHAHLNLTLKEFLIKRRSTSIKERFAIETKSLNPCPARDEGILSRVEEVRASDYGTVKFLGSTYSVPDTAIGLKCLVVAGPYDVKINKLDGKTLIVLHPRQAEKQNSILLEHVLRSLLRKPKAMVRWTHREILFPDQALKALYQHLKRQEEFNSEREFLKIINLVHQVQLSEIVAAISLLLESREKINFEDVRDLLLTERRPQNIYEISEKYNQAPLHPNLEVYNELIPKTGG